MHTHSHTHTTILWTSWILSGTSQVSWHQKGKTNLDLLQQEIASGSGIMCAICKSAPWHMHTTLQLSGFCSDNPGEPAPEETFTHTHRGHQLSLIRFIHLIWSLASSVLNLCIWQSFSTISKFSLVLLLIWHPPLHTLYISSPSHCLLFATHAHTIATSFAVLPRLCHLILVSLSTLYLELLSCSFTPHIHLTIFISARSCCTLTQTQPRQHPALCFLQAGCPSCHPTNSIKTLKAIKLINADFCKFSSLHYYQ